MNRSPAPHPHGTTLVEMMFTIAILSVVLITLQQGVSMSLSLHSSGSTTMALEDVGRQAISAIAAELRRSGVADHPANPGVTYWSYPYMWEGNDPSGEGYASGPYDSYALNADDVPLDIIEESYSPDALAGDPASGPSDSIVFRTPSRQGSAITDTDGNPLPLQNVGGEIELRWGAEKAIYLRASPHGGHNELVLYDSATGTEKVLCRHVERVAFNNYVQGTEEIRNQVRVQLYLRRRSRQGEWLNADLSATVSMRSSEED